MYIDLPEAELRDYRGSGREPADFDAFWSSTLEEARRHPIAVTAERVSTPLAMVDVYDVSFAGFGGQRVRAWLRVPAGTDAPLPAVVQFHGYGRGRGDAIENLLWASAGYAHLELDTRGQAWSGSRGATADEAGSGPAVPGFLTRGIEHRETFYFRRLITDAVRLTDAARALPLVDERRLAVTGISQGGGLALAVAGLVPGLAGVISRVPFLCDFPRATVITDARPYREIADYLSWYRDRTEQVLDTLSYFDGANFAQRATAPLWITAALMDAVCPPSTVFAAYNRYMGPKRITVWQYNGHEGGGVDDDLLALEALAEVLAPS
ncbi:acetylxylan esterase [Agromyces laixinhei]|uniref:acetylxylan esterase n=1 Tax=Agromyces laixinhei TaxID=2585717 RepID=UPI0012EDB2BA|nr:acetylxylan esterase [Agromyces laixinhei]